MFKFLLVLISFQVILLPASELFAQHEEVSESTEVTRVTLAEEPSPIHTDKFDHVELNGVFVSVALVLAFLIVIFIVLKYFIYLPDEKRKEIE